MKLILCSRCNQHHLSNQICNVCSQQSNLRINPSKGILPILLGLTIGACQEPDEEVKALYGIEETGDYDGDGWMAEEDCNDNDPTIHPEAEETLDDGIDSNCNDDDNT